MAYAFTVSAPALEYRNERRYATFTVIETDVSAGDEWQIDIPSASVVSLYEADITDAGGSGALTLDPDLGVAAGFTAGAIDSLPGNAVAAAHIFNQDDIRIRAGVPTLYGHSNPDAPNVNEITTKVTLRWGHV